MQPKTILLVNCGRTAAYRSESTGYLGSSAAKETPKADIAPLVLATVAALTPPAYEVELWDDVLEMLRDNELTDDSFKDRSFSIVGLTGYSVHIERMREVAEIFRRRGSLIVVGGPGASAEPEMMRGFCDVLFINEAEKTWPQFLADWERGEHKAEYFQIDKPDLSSVPMPRWNNLETRLVTDYRAGAVQTTRGCPFDCEFCDVIYLYGRKQRHKLVETVIAEVREQHRLGMRMAMFVDDEFVGDKKYAFEVARALRAFNRTVDEPMGVATQLTMTLARDEELIATMADANFVRALIGIETPNELSLRETGKLQNVRSSVDAMVADIHKIQSYGMGIRSSFIIGFDNDGPDIFDRHLDFYQRSYLPWLTVNFLAAPMGTPLWTRLRQEGRVLDAHKMAATLQLTQSRVSITTVPKKLTFREVFEGFAYLYHELQSWPRFADRMCGWLSVLKRPPDVQLRAAKAEELHAAVARFNPHASARAACDRIVECVHATHPTFLSRIILWTAWFAGLQTFYQQMHADYQQLVALERQGKLVPIFEDRPLRVPPGFIDNLGPLFARIHQHVFLSLDDPSRAAEALHRIFVDFVVRWGEDAQQPGFGDDKAQGFLTEISDRVCALINDESPERFVPERYAGQRQIPNHRRERLWETIVKSVSDELALVGTASAPDAKSPGSRGGLVQLRTPVRVP